MDAEASTLKDQINELERWFKPLRDDQRRVIVARLARIPGAALKDIVSSLIDESPPGGRFPTISQIRMEWARWVKDNPAKITRRPKTKCQECAPGAPEGTGFLWFKVYEDGRLVEYVCRCARCRNWRDDVAPGALAESTRDGLRDRGCLIWPYESQDEVPF